MPDDAEANEREIMELAQQIERYLAAHPQAADSLAGIVRWWLTRQHYEVSAHKVMRAAEHLVRAGKVQKQTTADGTTIYAARRS
jgi:hypothetical protein